MINTATMNKRNRQKGQALVESALVVLIFLCMLISTFDFAQVLFVHNSLVNRVRISLRWAAMNPYDEISVKNMVRYSQATQPQGAQAYLGLTESQINVTRFDTGTATERIQIAIVNHPYHFFTPLMARVFTNDLAVVATLPTEYRP